MAAQLEAVHSHFAIRHCPVQQTAQHQGLTLPQFIISTIPFCCVCLVAGLFMTVALCVASPPWAPRCAPV
jgi:hypothetical protein